MLWMCACRPRVMRLCGMEVFFWGHPSTQLARAKLFSFFLFCFVFNIWLSLFFDIWFHKIDGLNGRHPFFFYPHHLPAWVCPTLLWFFLSIPAKFFNSLSTTQKVCLITENGSAEDSGICLAFCVHWLCLCVYVKALAAVQLRAMHSKKKCPSQFVGLRPCPCMRGCKRASKLSCLSLKVPGAGGGLRALGGWGLQRKGETERQERRNRWAEMGRMVGRQTAEESFKKREKTAQDKVVAVTIRSQNLPSPSSRWRSKGKSSRWRVRGEREISVLFPTRKDPEQGVLCPYFRFAQIHSARGKKGGKDGKRWEQEHWATDRGNKVGALVLVGVWMYCTCWSFRMFCVKKYFKLKALVLAT